MPSRVYEGDINIPAGTAIAAPLTQVVNVPVGNIRKVTLVFPPGPSGMVGWQLLLAGTPIIPYGGAPWLIADNYRDDWYIDQDVNPGQLAVAGYNLDIFPHIIYARLEWLPPQIPPAVQIPSAAAVAAGPDTSALDGLSSGQGVPAAADQTGQLPVPVAVCYDAAGVIVDCASAAAVSGPVTYVPPAVQAPSGGAQAPPGGRPLRPQQQPPAQRPRPKPRTPARIPIPPPRRQR